MKDEAVWFYRQLTRPYRKKLHHDLCSDGKLPVSIVFYHRVADTATNPWTISSSDFCRQLDWLQEYFDVVSLEEAQARIASDDQRDRQAVAITFDDGYSDNAKFAIPELVRRNLPATYFVTTEFVRSGQPFPHDIELGVPLQPNTIREIQSFAEQGIEIGAHTRRHANIGAIEDPELLYDEIVGSIEDLREWLGRDVRYFAFPYGFPENTSQAAVDLMLENGIVGFCTAYGALNWPGSQAIHLRRFHADPGLQRFKNWLTLDHRKLQDHRQLPFDEARLQEIFMDHRSLVSAQSDC